MPEQDAIRTCRHCNNTTAFRICGAYTYNYDPELGETSYEGASIKWELWKCRTCSKPTLVSVSNAYHTVSYKDGTDEIVYDVDDEEKVLYPPEKTQIGPANDMPEDVRTDFCEALEIVDNSPRASAALLRLAIQKLCKHLGEPGKNINNDIASLVKNKGLSPKVQRSLDIVRVIGNNAVHPGEIDIQDNKETVITLFKLVNFIIEEMITRPKEIEEIYNTLPESARKAIETRDQPSKLHKATDV